MKTLFMTLVGSLFVCTVYAQNCPTKHPALTALDHATMVEAYTASFRGLYGRNPTMQAGSGPDDGNYWVAVSDHYGEFSDGICRAGWNAYWETKVGSLAESVSPTLGDQPARFQPHSAPAPVPAPVPVPAPAPVPAFDYTPLLQQLLAAQNLLVSTQQQMLVLTQDTNRQVTEINRTFAQTLGSAMKWMGKYVGPAIMGFIAARKL